MSINDLQPITDTTYIFPFFDNIQPTEHLYKIYNDGSHYIARLVTNAFFAPTTTHKSLEDIDILFDSLYYEALKRDLARVDLIEHIRQGLLKQYPYMADINVYIEKMIERKLKNLYNRKKRFRRKACLNQWNYFVTITYDDKKHSAESFRKKLRKCLSNLHTRRGWRYMGVFENAPDTGRLHFHAIMYIPCGEMIGQLNQHSDYDTRSCKMRVTTENCFFTNNFGRNDFEELNEMELKNGNAINYIIKYLGKTNERIVYARGILTELCKKLKDTEIVTTMFDFVTKYILFDDVIDWEIDVLNLKRKQMSLSDLMYNLPRS